MTKIKVSEFLALQIDHLSDISKFLYNREDALSFELAKEIEKVETNLNTLFLVLIKKEREPLKNSEL